MHTDFLERIATPLLVSCALVTTVLFVRREFSPKPDPRAPRPPVAVKDWEQYSAGDMRIGRPDAPIRIVEFSDFQCPFCKQMFRELQGIRAKYPDAVMVVYRNFPIPQLHPFARSAAIAAECAASQLRFQDFHDYVFTHQDSIPSFAWTSVAARVGIQDTAAFSRCLIDPATSSRLRDDSIAAVGIDIHGTPTVLVNQWKYSGTPSGAEIEAMVLKELKLLRK
jgi:protein-disulfide isomerase